jgi:hypothetical protein
LAAVLDYAAINAAILPDGGRSGSIPSGKVNILNDQLYGLAGCCGEYGSIRKMPVEPLMAAEGGNVGKSEKLIYA